MFDPCILCLEKRGPLTDEHIFPEAAGGNISRYILCKYCNDKMGHCVDAPYVDQKHIQLARAAYNIAGKTGKIPQPFSEIYSVENSESKIKLDSKFIPRVVPQAPKVWITEKQEIGFSLSRDIQDKKKIPKIIRTALSRFFKSEEGISLGWSKEEEENAIQRSIHGASKVQSQSEQIQSSLHGSWTIDLKAIFVEHVKVIYEISYLEFGFTFLNNPSGERMRNFLLDRCAKKDESWELNEAAIHLNIVPQVVPNLDRLIRHITNDSPYTYHVVVVTAAGVICSMLGMGATFHISPQEQLTTSLDVAKVYLNSINQNKTGIYPLGELLNR